MPAVLNIDEVIGLDRIQLKHLQEIGDSYPDSNSPGACDAFQKEVDCLEGYVKFSYQMCVTAVKKTIDLKEIAEVWGKMDNFCSLVLDTLSNLKEKYPYCGTSDLHDSILEYKNACSQRYRGALEEIECQKISAPKGLFPEKI